MRGVGVVGGTREHVEHAAHEQSNALSNGGGLARGSDADDVGSHVGRMRRRVLRVRSDGFDVGGVVVWGWSRWYRRVVPDGNILLVENGLRSLLCGVGCLWCLSRRFEGCVVLGGVTVP